MANRRIDMHEYREVIYRLRQQQSERAIARSGIMGRHKTNEIGQIARLRGWLDPETPLPELAAIEQALREHRAQGKLRPVGRQSGLSSAHLTLIAQWFEHGVNAVAIHAALQRNHGVRCHYSSVRRAVNQLKAAQPQVRPTMILDFKLGEAAQVDFGAGPFLPDPTSGKPKRTWFFVMTLCASRHQYVEFVWDQTVATWLRCHQRAFEFFGATPARLIIDNPKCAIIKAVLHETEVQRAYGELAQGYGFLIDPCPPADPQKKGRVESGVKYVKRNFLPTRQFRHLADLNEQVTHWVLHVAGQRIHGSTYAKPLEQFELERPYLKPLPERRPDVYWYAQAKVHRDCHVQHERCLYSVPYRLVGQTVQLRLCASTVEVFDGQDLVTTHPRGQRPGQRQTINDHMPEAAVAWLMQSPAWCREQAQAVGPHCHALIMNLFGDRILQRLRTVQGVLRLRHEFGDHWLELACQRCGVVDSISPKVMRHVIEQLQDEAKAGLLPDTGAEFGASSAYQGKGRFARDTRQMMLQ